MGPGPTDCTRYSETLLSILLCTFDLCEKMISFLDWNSHDFPSKPRESSRNGPYCSFNLASYTRSRISLTPLVRGVMESNTTSKFLSWSSYATVYRWHLILVEWKTSCNKVYVFLSLYSFRWFPTLGWKSTSRELWCEGETQWRELCQENQTHNWFYNSVIILSFFL